MGLMQRTLETYQAMEAKYAGRYTAGQEPLVPISHQIIKAEIEITLDADGALLDAALDKNQSAIIIPVTEKSAGRTGNNAGDHPHPLCDQIRFMVPCSGKKYEAYLAQLQDWEGSAYSHPKLRAVLRYVKKGTILPDLLQRGLIKLDGQGLPANEKALVCWRVLGDGSGTPECWKDQSLFHAFINYYAARQSGEENYCMVSGEYAVTAIQHPKKIITANQNANAKLISSKDTSGFTYRGRFTDDRQALTISYAASQKAHNALHWLAANQGVSIGGRTFLCWNPQGIPLPQPNSPVLRGAGEKRFKPSDYKAELDRTLRGWKDQLPEDAWAVVAAFDAATTGRLSLTYYSELRAVDFVERLHAWDNVCQWYNGQFGAQSPSLFQIVNCAFGTPRTENQSTRFVADEGVVRQQVQRLLACRVDRRTMPRDIVQALVSRASNLQILDFGPRQTMLFTACAVIRKYHYDTTGEEWKMTLEPEKHDISYQYGRLLAVLEKAERDTYGEDENREPNAMRMQMVYARRPRYAARIVWEQVKTAYLPRLKPASRVFYDRLIGQIVEMIAAFPDSQQNRPLGDSYMMGYSLQKRALYQSKTEQDETEE